MIATESQPKDASVEYRVSALTHAAKISSFIVNGTTIGPRSVPNNSNSNNAHSAGASKVVETPQSVAKGEPAKSLWRYDAWRSVSRNDEDEEASSSHHRHTTSTLTMNDCKAVKFSMALRSASKVVHQQSRKAQQERQAKYDDLCSALQKVKIDATARALSAVQQDRLAKEEQILELVRRFDEEARATDEANRQQQEEQNRRRSERALQLKREEEIRGFYEELKSSQSLFVMAFEKYANTAQQNQHQLPNFAEHCQEQEVFVQRFEEVLRIVNGGRITEEEVAALEKCCDDLCAKQRELEEEIESNSDRLQQMAAEQAEAAAKLAREQQEQLEVERQKSLEQVHQRQEQEQIQQQKQEQEQVAPLSGDAVDHQPVGGSGDQQQIALNRFVSEDRLAFYQQTIAFYEEYAQSVKPLQQDDNMKPFRFSCQKAVNIPLNAISSVSAGHLQDKYDKLVLLLSGVSVKVADIQVSSAAHPLGVRFCTLLIAKKLVNLSDLVVSSQPRSAFPIAAIVVALWRRNSDLGRLFLAYVYKECPYMVPYFVPQHSGQTTEDYLKSIGYRYEQGVLESGDKYLKRQGGLIRLYAAVMVSKVRREQTGLNPHGLDNGWIWLVNILKLDPLPDICATLIYEFLVIAGSDMWRLYGRQFPKLLATIKNQYMAKLNAIDTGGPKNRLDELVNKLLKENTIAPADGRLPPNFW